MPAVRIVPALDEREDRGAGVGLGAEGAPIHQLALERREETLAQGVVVTIAHRPSRRPHPHRLASLAERNRGVLRPVIGMMVRRRYEAPTTDAPQSRGPHQASDPLSPDAIH